MAIINKYCSSKDKKMSYDITDPWADKTLSNKKLTNNEDGFARIESMSNTLNIFGDSSTSSMVDSMIGDSDPLRYSSNNNWGEYNSFNILTQNNNEVKSSKSNAATILNGISSLNIINKEPQNNIQNESLNILGNISNEINTPEIMGDGANDESDDFDNDENEEDLTSPMNIKVWSDSEIKSFNPLSLKNSADGIVVKVREIPEKEGLVFKHTNYLISHTLKFSSEYFIPSDSNSKSTGQEQRNKTNNNETKVIRRYSDFAWLVEALWKKYPFRLIPELPPKKFACKY